MPNQNLSQNAETCPAVGYQKANVCVPVTITPFAHPGDTKTFCCGEPVVTPGKTTCEGVIGGKCSFIITQTICVAVPVEFGATSQVGDAAIKAGETSSKNICYKCDCASDEYDDLDDSSFCCKCN